MLEKYLGRCLYFCALALLGMGIWSAMSGDGWGIALGVVLVFMSVLYVALGIVFINWNNRYFVRRFGK